MIHASEGGDCGADPHAVSEFPCQETAAGPSRQRDREPLRTERARHREGALFLPEASINAVELKADDSPPP